MSEGIQRFTISNLNRPDGRCMESTIQLLIKRSTLSKLITDRRRRRRRRRSFITTIKRTKNLLMRLTIKWETSQFNN
jgi:hypothetical protein